MPLARHREIHQGFRSWRAIGAIALCAVALLPQGAAAQRLQFRQITPDDGLAGSWVPAILQDSRGFMWFGTSRGVNRYDGAAFAVYQHADDDSSSIAADLATVIYEDGARRLWFGTRFGLSEYRRERDAFVNHRLVAAPDSAGVSSILDGPGDTLWVGTTRGLYRFDRRSGRAFPFSADTSSPLMNTEIRVLHPGSGGTVWIGTATKGLQRLDAATGRLRGWRFDAHDARTLPADEVRGIVVGADGMVWIGTYGGGVARLDPRDGALTRFSHRDGDPRSLANNSVMAFIADGAGSLWVGTENGGLDHLDPATTRFEHYRFDPNDAAGLNSNSIESLYRDRAGTLWVGTFAGGVNISRRNGDALRRYRSIPGDAGSLSFNSVLAFTEDSRGAIWVATDGGGLNRFDRASGRFAHYSTANSNIGSDAVLSVTEDAAGRIWVGTWAGGVARLDRTTGRFTTFTTRNSDIGDDNVFAVHADRAGDVWVGTVKAGLARFDERRGSFVGVPIFARGEAAVTVRVIDDARDGALLVATEGRGLAVVDPRTLDVRWYRAEGKQGQRLSSNSVQSVFEGDSGILWIGTASGLDRLDRTSGAVTHFGKVDGLPSTFVTGVAGDDAGMLWLSSDRGIVRFDPRAKLAKIFTVADGLQGTEFNPGAAFRGRDGALYFGGGRGFNVIRPAAMTENRHVPQVVLTGFQLFNKPVPIGARGSPLTASIETLDRLTLRPGQSAFSISFAALDYTAPEKNEYAYRLEGFESEWNVGRGLRTASYTNLPPGKYVFRVKGSNNDGVWNDAGASLPITVVPPFYKRWWFKGLLLIAAGGLIALVIRAAGERRRNLEAMNATLAASAERDRASQQYLERNVLEILEAMERFSDGDLTVELDVGGSDTIGSLRRGVNRAVGDIRAMVQRVREVLDATVRTSREIHASTERLAAGAEEQIDQALLVAGAAQQMAQVVTGNARSIATAAEMAQRSGSEAQEGGRIVRDTFEGMDQIVSGVAASARTVEALGDSSAQIAAITRVIDEIATQTNLLALNSAIEAARAGKHGAAFAIVATEMQQLAEQTARATKQIATVIRDNERHVGNAVESMGLVTRRIERGRALVDQAGGALDGIIANSERMLAQIQQVRASSEEQAATTAHISENIETISRVTRAAAEGNQTIATSVQGLSELIEDLQRRVARFRLAGGAAGGQLPSAGRPSRETA